MKTLIIEDVPLVREWLASACSAAGLPVLCMAASVSDGIAAVDRLAPELVLIDLRLGGESGLDVAAHCNALARPPAVALVTAYQPSAVVRAMDWFGLRAFLTKDIGFDELVDRLKYLAAGGVTWTTAASPYAPTDWERRLTRREVDTLLAVGRFATDRAGAELLGISEDRFAKHRLSAARILGVEGPLIHKFCRDAGMDLLPFGPRLFADT